MPKRILIVDDEADITRLLAFNLTRAGFFVESAARGGEALEKAVAFQPDLILLDLMLPELDGLAICEILRDLPATRRTPIFILTAYASEQIEAASRASGATECLGKPFSPRRLVNRITRLLGPDRTPHGRAA
jgi:two-component system, OmpR family, alkaline phosphatase synthesis response regulator PhoP